MKTPLRVLIVEDSEDDALLVREELQRSGFDVTHERVDDAEAMRAALNRQDWDIVISDYSMPRFSGPAALKVLRASARDIPFIVVSGTVGEDIAVGMMRDGASDYLMKDNLARLGVAVARELRQAAGRRARQQTQQALRETESRFRTLFEHAPVGVVLIDPASASVLECNELAARQLGYTLEEFLTLRISDFEAVETPDQTRAHVENLVRGGADVFETRHRTKTGEIRDVWVSVRAVEVAGRKVLHCIYLDISGRKRAEEARIRLLTAIEQAAEAIITTDTAGAIQYVNPAFERISGYTREEVIGQNPRLLKSDRHDPAFYREMWDTVRRGEVWRGKFINQNKAGGLYEEEATVAPIRDAAGKITGYVSVQRDVTRERELEQQFLQAQKMEAIALLAGGVAHDFNNILMVIQGNVGFLRDLPDPTGEMADSLKNIADAADRAAALTRQLLAFSHKQAMKPQALDLSGAVNDLSKMLRRVIGEDVALRLEPEPDLPAVHADVGMMEQVLMNLAVNARDAMPKGGSLTISAQVIRVDAFHVARCAAARAGEFVRVSVRDSGTGIPPAVLPRIFEPFFTTKAAGKGTGLGLATVHGIVHQHEGWVEVETTVGAGTTFHVYLPARRDLQPAVQKPVPASALPGGTEGILLVEDEPAVRDMTTVALKRLGYRVFAAHSGVKALELWDTHGDEIDLVLSDVIMPEGMNGRELVEQLLARQPGLKAILVSGYTADVLDEPWVQERSVRFLAKPFALPALAQAVRDALDTERHAPAGGG